MKYSQCDHGSSAEDVNRENDLQSALDAMLAVLRCVNDSMHQVAITGYQVDCLIRFLIRPQFPFNILIMKSLFS